MNQSPIIPIGRAGAILGFLGMAALGWSLASPAPEMRKAQGTSQASVRSVARPDRPARHSGQPEEVRKRMTAIHGADSSANRLRATLELAQTLPISEIGEWLDSGWFDQRNGAELTLFNKILLERWKTEDPEGLVAWCTKNRRSDANGILDSWASNDPQRLLGFFKQRPNPQQELEILSKLAAKNPTVALQGLKDLLANGTPQSFEYYSRDLLKELAKSSPAVLEHELESLPFSIRKTAEAVLCNQRLEASFNDEFHRLLKRPDGSLLFFNSIESPKGVGDKLFGELVNLPTGWKKAVAENSGSLIDEANSRTWWNADLEGMGFSASDANRIRFNAMERIGQKSPEEALMLMSSLTLEDYQKQNFLSNLFSNQTSNPERAEALFAQLGTEADQKIARAAIDRNSDSPSNQKIDTPNDWLEKVGSVDPARDTFQYTSKLSTWDAAKIADLTQQFHSLPDASKKRVAKALAESAYTVPIPLQAEALVYQIAHPETPQESSNLSPANSSTILQSSQLAVTWAKTDPAAASHWVQSLPNGPDRSWAQKNLALNWTQYDPEAAGQWIQTLPSNERTQVQDYVKKGAEQ